MSQQGECDLAPEAVGRQQVARCQIDPARAAALSAALGLPDRFKHGDPLPPFYHQIYFWDIQPPAELGRDGHTRIGIFVPDLGLRRRMWAGGHLQFNAPILAGVPAEKRSTIIRVDQKNGRSGPLAIVTIRHEIWQQDQLCTIEDQDLIYRTEHDPNAPTPIAPKARNDEQSCDRMQFSTTLLFRYSALTLNGHRIHYDQDYAQNDEGYSGLVVHGPLLAQVLMLQAEREVGPLSKFSFRSTSPLMQGEEADCCRAGQNLWIRGADGRQIMRASGEWAS